MKAFDEDNLDDVEQILARALSAGYQSLEKLRFSSSFFLASFIIQILLNTFNDKGTERHSFQYKRNKRLGHVSFKNKSLLSRY